MIPRKDDTTVDAIGNLPVFLGACPFADDGLSGRSHSIRQLLAAFNTLEQVRVRLRRVRRWSEASIQKGHSSTTSESVRNSWSLRTAASTLSETLFVSDSSRSDPPSIEAFLDSSRMPPSAPPCSIAVRLLPGSTIRSSERTDERAATAASGLPGEQRLLRQAVQEFEGLEFGDCCHDAFSSATWGFPHFSFEILAAGPSRSRLVGRDDCFTSGQRRLVGEA